MVDLNLDELLDLVEVNRVENVRIWRNVGAGSAGEPEAMGNWMAVRLAQDGTNRLGIGAWIEVRIGEHLMTREVTIGGGHSSGSLSWAHFGLGPASTAEVRVVWPDGATGRWLEVEAGQRVTVVRGSEDELDVWEAPSS